MAAAWRSALLRSAPLQQALCSELRLGVAGGWAALASVLAPVPQLTNLAHCRHSSSAVSPEPRLIRDFAIIGALLPISSYTFLTASCYDCVATLVPLRCVVNYSVAFPRCACTPARAHTHTHTHV